IAYACCILIYIILLLYGSQVMMGVMEEKTNRIVEVIVSSVKPFELMLGKILGVAILGIIQFVCMGIITLALSSLLSAFFLKDAASQLKVFEQQQELVKKQGTNLNLSKLEKFDDKLELF